MSDEKNVRKASGDCEDCEVMSVSPGVLTEQYSESGFLQ